MPETRLKTAAQSELASLIHARDLPVKQRARLLNKTHAPHTRHGVKPKQQSSGSKRRLKALGIAWLSGLDRIEPNTPRDRTPSPTDAIGALIGR